MSTVSSRRRTCTCYQILLLGLDFENVDNIDRRFELPGPMERSIEHFTCRHPRRAFCSAG